MNTVDKNIKQLVVETFKKAINEKYKYVAVVLLTANGYEYVVTSDDFFVKKKQYYMDNFISNGLSRFGLKEKIIDVDYADYVDELRWFKEDWSGTHD